MIIDIKRFLRFADKKIDFRKFTKFGITGVINTGVDWLAFAFLREILGIDPKFAQVAAQALAIANSYIINKNWTFKNNKRYKKSEICKFLLIQGTSLCLGYLGMFIFHDNIGLNAYLCKIIIACSTVVINYFGNKLFVFK